MSTPRLTMTSPAEWPVSGLTLVVDPVMALAPEDDVAQAALSRELPEGCHLTPGDRHGGLSAEGWPVQLVQGRVIDGAGAQRETRLVAVYRLIDWIGTIRLIATDRDAWEAHRGAVLTAMMSGQLAVPPGVAALRDALGS